MVAAEMIPTLSKTNGHGISLRSEPEAPSHRTRASESGAMASGAKVTIIISATMRESAATAS